MLALIAQADSISSQLGTMRGDGENAKKEEGKRSSGGVRDAGADRRDAGGNSGRGVAGEAAEDVAVYGRSGAEEVGASASGGSNHRVIAVLGQVLSHLVCGVSMSLIGSIIRRLGINVGNSSGSTHQTVRDSQGVQQAGRDVVNILTSSESKKSHPVIGEAYFSDSGLTLSVHDFRAGGDMGDNRYHASFGIEHVALFVAAIEEADYDAFQMRDNQGTVNLPCTVTVPEGCYEGTVTHIEIGQRELSCLGLRCWLKVP